MRKYILYFFGLSLLVFSCDVIEMPYPEGSDPTTPSDSSACLATDSNNYRKILIEDYTGFTCGNCPPAAEKAKELKTRYGDTVIVMALHVGTTFAEPRTSGVKYLNDYRSEEGEIYSEKYENDQQGLPNGIISRSDTLGILLLDYTTQWEDAVIKLKNAPAIAALNYDISYDASTRIAKASVSVLPLQNLSGNYNVVISMTEDSIVDWQKDYSQTPEDVEFYMHRHLFRGTMNGAFGSSVISGSAASGDCIELSEKSFTFPSAWNENQMSIVITFINADTDEVMQVAEEHIHL